MSADEDAVVQGAVESSSDSLKQVADDEPTAVGGSVNDEDNPVVEGAVESNSDSLKQVADKERTAAGGSRDDEEDPVVESAAESNSGSLNQVTDEEPTAGGGSVDGVEHSPKENGSCNGDPVLDELSHDQLVQQILDLKYQNEYLKSQYKGLHNHRLATAVSDLQIHEKEQDGVHEDLEKLHTKIESLSKELVVEKQTREAAEKALEHVRTAHLEADGRAQELFVKLDEVEKKMEQEIKGRDDKYSELDLKFTRLHKRAKQRIQDVQKEKDDLEAKLKEVNEKADRTSSQLSALQQELERTRQQANEALRTMDAERQQLRSANNKLRDNIEELRHSLQPKERALEELQQSLSEKQQMIDELRGLLKDADEKRQASLADLSSKNQKNIESLEAQLADAMSDRDKATGTISSLQARLVERESEIAELDAALSGEAVRSKAAVESVKGELLNLKHEQEKEKENWETSYQAVKRKLEAAESNYIRVEVEAAKTRSQLELELSVKTQSLNSKDSELAAASEKISRLEADFSSYKVRAHSLLQKKDAELATVQDSEQVKALEEALKEAEMEISSLTSERDQSLEKLQNAFANHGRELKDRDTTIHSLEQRIQNLEKKLDSDNARHQSEKQAWESNLQNVEETWHLKYEGLKAQTEASARPDLEKEFEDCKQKYRKLKEEHDSHRDLADRMIEEKDNELSRILAMNKKLQWSMESKPYVEDDYRHNTDPMTPQKQDTSSASVAEQQILILARQQAQREEELSQSQRHIFALQEEIEELERENRLHNQQVIMLKEELRSMDRTQKREGVDMTYLKNVVLKLLETGEVLALLPVVAMLLQFSPDEVLKCQQAYRNNTSSEAPTANGGLASQETSRSLFSRFSFV